MLEVTAEDTVQKTKHAASAGMLVPLTHQCLHGLLYSVLGTGQGCTHGAWLPMDTQAYLHLTLT